MTVRNIKSELNPQYMKELEKIKKQKGIRFNKIEDFETYLSKL